MHVQIVTYALDGITESEYLDIATDLAPRFAAVPGLLAKLWLESPDAGTYGAIYFWDDREAMERFVAGQLFEGTGPDFVDVDYREYSILQNLTRATQPALTLVEDPAPPPRAVRPAATRALKAAKPPAAPKAATPAKAVSAGAAKAPARAKPAGTAAAAKVAGATAKATKKAAPKAPAAGRTRRPAG